MKSSENLEVDINLSKFDKLTLKEFENDKTQIQEFVKKLKQTHDLQFEINPK